MYMKEVSAKKLRNITTYTQSFYHFYIYLQESVSAEKLFNNWQLNYY